MQFAVFGAQFYDGPRKEKYQLYNTVLTDLNMAFTIMFTIEMILKQLGFGLRVWHCLLHF